jgi:hypothetical protein
MDRTQLIDYIDSYYDQDYEVVERILENVYGYNMNTIEQDASHDYDYDTEGFYAVFSDTQLKEIAEELDSCFMNDNKLNIELKISESELRVLIDAMENYSEPSFTKDLMMSKVAQRLLTRLYKI